MLLPTAQFTLGYSRSLGGRIRNFEVGPWWEPGLPVSHGYRIFFIFIVWKWYILVHFVAFHRYDDMSLDVTVKALVKHITAVYFIVCPPRHVFFCAEVTLFFM